LNLSYQQNLAGSKISIVVLGYDRWTLIKPHVGASGRSGERGDAWQLHRGEKSLRVSPVGQVIQFL
jgi:hypothetical protein